MALDREKLINYLSNDLGVETDELDDETPIFSSGLLDSFTMVDVIMFIEQEGGIKIEPMEVNLENLDSIERILRFVDSHSS
jgi:acyl carrier protein